MEATDVKERPDYHDADLALKVYDLRREPVMREARNAINFTFWPKTLDEVAAVLKPDHPLNSAWRQTSSYWEMVYSMARHGIVSPDYWVENNGEGLFLFAKVAPFLAEVRAKTSAAAFRNAEWLATETAEGRRVFQMLSERVKRMTASR
jgi:hypothetical protein